jgi:diguanylate cyclase (GGDEF)-like protein
MTIAPTNHSHSRLRRFQSGFATRLALALVLALAVMGAAGYVEVTHLLQERIVAQEAVYQQAQAETMQAVARGLGRREAVAQIDKLIDAATRPGAIETLLIDPDSMVVAAHDNSEVGTNDSDLRIEAALRDDVAYAGREADPERDSRDFEFVTPVRVAGRRYAFESTYDEAFFAQELGEIRRTMTLLVIIGLIGGGGAFYVVGGRTLIRSHRFALERATRDGLTDLGNQRAFRDDLEHAVALAGRQGGTLALAYIDIDDFKFLNDRHGHRHGDELLMRVAAVLGDGRISDRAFRIGGDEFALLLAGTDVDGATLTARRLQRAFAEAQVTASIGLSALRPGEDATALREEADAALGEAKRRGGASLIVFDDIRDSIAITTGAKVQALHDLLEDGDVGVAFQPIWDLAGATLLGVEALARPDARYGFSGPAEAFDIAEQLGRVHELDMLCVERSLARAVELPADALLFLNVAPRTLDLDADGDGWLVAAVERSGIDASRVVIEVTERFGGRMSSVVKSLQRLRDAGLKLALDDVGAGNSGLEMLRQVDVQFVKIDRSIVMGAMTEPGARAVLLAIATYANETGSFVIAEGIEDDDVLGFVRHLDADLTIERPRIQGGQGYGLGRPAPTMPSSKPSAVLLNDGGPLVPALVAALW